MISATSAPTRVLSESQQSPVFSHRVMYAHPGSTAQCSAQAATEAEAGYHVSPTSAAPPT